MGDILTSDAAQYGSNMAIYVVVAAIFLIIGAILIVARVLSAMNTMKQSMAEVQEANTKKALEEQKKLDEIIKLARWIENVQTDLNDNNVGTIIALDGINALLNHAIDVQHANGKCHKSRDEIESYLRKKSLSMVSYSDPKDS